MRKLRMAIAAIALASTGGVWLAPGTASAGGGGGCMLEPAPASGSPVTGTEVDVAAMCFQTPVLYTETGSTVTWTNSDSVPHTVTGSFGSKDIRPGKAVRFTFSEAGVFPYACIYHPGMVGTVVVGDATAPGVAVSEVSPAAGGGGGSTKADATRAASARPPSPSRTGVALLAGAVGLAVGAAAGFGLRVARRRPVATVGR